MKFLTVASVVAVVCATLVSATSKSVSTQAASFEEFREQASSIHNRLGAILKHGNLDDVKAVLLKDIVLREKGKHAGRSDVKRIKRADADFVHTLTFNLAPIDAKVLERDFEDVSNPDHPRYGNYMTVDQIFDKHFGSARLESLKNMLVVLGAEVEAKQFHIIAKAPISLWESILNTKFHEHEVTLLDGSARKYVRADEFSLPKPVHDLVSFVDGAVNIPRIRGKPLKRKVDSTSTATYNGYVTPTTLYNTYDIRSTNASLISQGVYEDPSQTGFGKVDLATFQAHFKLPLEPVDAFMGVYPDTCNSDGNCYEPNLDVQYMMAVAEYTYFSYWNYQDFNGWLFDVATLGVSANVLSISYGADEAFVTTNEATTFGNYAMILALQGTSIVVSAGDDGVASVNARQASEFCGYSPSYPASSPYVTAVGATMGPESGLPEVVCQSQLGGVITSGGGFSYMYNTPSWQQTQVTNYFSTAIAENKDPMKGYSNIGRGYPDVSLLGLNYEVVVDGQLAAVSGTSASAPVFGGMISLVNQARKKKGMALLGFMNPLLYKLSSKFTNDITSGTNNCAAEGIVCCQQGFTATTGWDPASGLGSVNVTALINAVMSYYPAGNYPTSTPVTFQSSPPTMPMETTNGWVYMNTYSNSDCTGDVLIVNAIPSEKCLPYYVSSNGTVHAYAKFSCYMNAFDANMVNAALFFDSSCLVPYFPGSISSYPLFSQCSSEEQFEITISEQEYEYIYETTYSNLLSCTTESVPNSMIPLLPSDTSNFDIVGYFADQKCSPEDYTGSVAYAIGECIYLFGGGVYFNGPYVNIFPNCEDYSFSKKNAFYIDDSCVTYDYQYYDTVMMDYHAAVGQQWMVGSQVSTSSSSSSLSTGAVAGIAIGSVAGAGLIGAGAYVGYTAYVAKPPLAASATAEMNKI